MSAGYLALAQVGTGLAKGIAGYYSGLAQKDMLEADGIVLQSEADREARRIQEEGDRFLQEQKLAYIGSGVEIGGSAVVTLAQTDKWNKAESKAVRDRGASIRRYYDRSGRIAKNQGKASFVSEIAGGISKGLSTYNRARGVKTGGTTSGGGTSTKTTSDNAYARRQNARQKRAWGL